MKYKYEAIAEATAAMILVAIAANPSIAILAQGFLGRVTFFVLKLLCMFLANLGLVILNVGAAKIETIIDGGNFDGSWEQAEEMIKKIQDAGREMSQDEIKKIDQIAIDAFRKFISFGRVRARRNT